MSWFSSLIHPLEAATAAIAKHVEQAKAGAPDAISDAVIGALALSQLPGEKAELDRLLLQAIADRSTATAFEALQTFCTNHQDLLPNDPSTNSQLQISNDLPNLLRIRGLLRVEVPSSSKTKIQLATHKAFAKIGMMFLEMLGDKPPQSMKERVYSILARLELGTISPMKASEEVAKVLQVRVRIQGIPVFGKNPEPPRAAPNQFGSLAEPSDQELENQLKAEKQRIQRATTPTVPDIEEPENAQSPPPTARAGRVARTSESPPRSPLPEPTALRTSIEQEEQKLLGYVQLGARFTLVHSLFCRQETNLETLINLLGQQGAERLLLNRLLRDLPNTLWGKCKALGIRLSWKISSWIVSPLAKNLCQHYIQRINSICFDPKGPASLVLENILPNLAGFLEIINGAFTRVATNRNATAALDKLLATELASAAANPEGIPSKTLYKKFILSHMRIASPSLWSRPFIWLAGVFLSNRLADGMGTIVEKTARSCTNPNGSLTALSQILSEQLELARTALGSRPQGTTSSLLLLTEADRALLESIVNNIRRIFTLVNCTTVHEVRKTEASSLRESINWLTKELPFELGSGFAVDQMAKLLQTIFQENRSPQLLLILLQKLNAVFTAGRPTRPLQPAESLSLTEKAFDLFARKFLEQHDPFMYRETTLTREAVSSIEQAFLRLSKCNAKVAEWEISTPTSEFVTTTERSILILESAPLREESIDPRVSQELRETVSSMHTGFLSWKNALQEMGSYATLFEEHNKLHAAEGQLRLDTLHFLPENTFRELCNNVATSQETKLSVILDSGVINSFQELVSAQKQREEVSSLLTNLDSNEKRKDTVPLAIDWLRRQEPFYALRNTNALRRLGLTLSQPPIQPESIPTPTPSWTNTLLSPFKRKPATLQHQEQPPTDSMRDLKQRLETHKTVLTDTLASLSGHLLRDLITPVAERVRQLEAMRLEHSFSRAQFRALRIMQQLQDWSKTHVTAPPVYEVYPISPEKLEKATLSCMNAFFKHVLLGSVKKVASKPYLYASGLRTLLLHPLIEKS